MKSYSQLATNITNWIKNYATKNGIKTLIVGVSGGIDSAVVSTLCARTGLATVVIEMPINNPNPSLGSKHVEQLTSNYENCRGEVVDLTSSFEVMKETILKSDSINNNQDNYHLMLANLASRLRMCTLYSFSNSFNGIVVGTGNKVEDFGVGFFTRGGDGTVDISPIADLMKSEVYKLGKELGVIKEILEVAPNDGLWEDGRTDEEQLGCSYEELEWAMLLQEKEGDSPDLSPYSEDQKRIWKTYLTWNLKNRYKMKEIPIFKKSEE